MSETISPSGAFARPTRSADLRLNPFFLLSALLMLGGLFALNGSLDWSPMPSGRLLILIGVLNVYELLLVGLGVWLIRRGLERDGLTLFTLEAVFLLDTGFLNSELITTRGGLGAGVYALLTVLAAVKLAVMFRVGGVGVRSGGYAFALGAFVLLGLIPGGLKWVANQHGGTLPDLTLHTAWWVLGAVPVAYGLLLRRTERHVVRVVGTLGVVALLAHVATAGFVHNVDWQRADLAPLLLGAALAIGVTNVTRWPRLVRQWTQLVLPVIALTLTLDAPATLQSESGPVDFSPFRFAAVAAVGVWLAGGLLHREPLFWIASAAGLALACLGVTPTAVGENLVVASRQARDLLVRLVPRTRTHWGVLAVAGSFVMLAIGVLTTLTKGKNRPI